MGHFEEYLRRVELHKLSNLSPELISNFVVDRSGLLSKSSQTGLCVCLRVFLQYLHREGMLSRDLSSCVESPRSYECAHIPRSISWDEVGKTLQAVDQRTPTGRRDYAVLLLLATYGLRGVEVAELKLEHIDWKRNRLLVPERKAGHCTAYPLSPVVGNAILEYLRNGRPQGADRHVFYRHLAPQRPMESAAVSARSAHYLKKAGIHVVLPGSHTLGHSCVQRLVDSDFPLKIIGDYVVHRSPSSTEIYTKINSVRIMDQETQESLSEYIARPPISLKKIRYEPFKGRVLFHTTYSEYYKENVHLFDALDFLAELTQHLRAAAYRPKGVRLIRRYALGTTDRENLRRLRAPVDPFVCPKCGYDMKVVAVIEDPDEVRRILRHLVKIGPGRAAVRLQVLVFPL